MSNDKKEKKITVAAEESAHLSLSLPCFLLFLPRTSRDFAVVAVDLRFSPFTHRSTLADNLSLLSLVNVFFSHASREISLSPPSIFDSPLSPIVAPSPTISLCSLVSVVQLRYIHSSPFCLIRLFNLVIWICVILFLRYLIIW